MATFVFGSFLLLMGDFEPESEVVGCVIWCAGGCQAAYACCQISEPGRTDFGSTACGSPGLVTSPNVRRQPLSGVGHTMVIIAIVLGIDKFLTFQGKLFAPVRAV